MDDGTRITPEVEEYLRAARAGEVARVSDLLKGKPDLLNEVEAGGYGALHFAAYKGDVAMIRMLLEHKPDLNLENYDGNTPLVMAVKGRQLDAIRTLAEAGADVNKSTSRGTTAAHHAASMGYLDCVRLLVDLGAKTTYEPSEAGSLVHWACQSGEVNVVGSLIYDYKIPIDTKDVHGGTPLFTALFAAKTEVVEFLLEHGSDPNTMISADGTTPLHIAVENANNECVRLLCSCGADPNAANREGETPLSAAERLKNSVTVRELKKSQVPKEKRAAEAVRFKEQGNKVFAQGENVKAAKFYTLSIRLDNTNHVYFSNRAACYFNQKHFIGAYWDAVRCISLAPQWPRGYVRKSATELALKRYEDAITTANAGLKLESSNKDLQNVKDEAVRQRR